MGEEEFTYGPQEQAAFQMEIKKVIREYEEAKARGGDVSKEVEAVKYVYDGVQPVGAISDNKEEEEKYSDQLLQILKEEKKIK